jgi:O-antigen ligase
MVFYESGKYAIAGFAILALLRYRLLSRSDKTPLIYFLLLLPSLLVLPEFDRRQISFNLSGPFALAMCTLFLSTQKISAEGLKKIFQATLAPILGLTFVATFSTVTTEDIDYSSKVAAGGLGNNQASSIFGLSLLLGFFYLFIDRRNRFLRVVAAVIAVWCGAQAALTFSRGGVVTAIGAIAAASFFLLRDRRVRGALVIRVGLFVVLAASLVVPQLNTMTEGALARRFSSTHLTGRDKIMKADMIAFRENPVFGVGPGGSKVYHARTFRLSSSHTEYSRLLAEHGLFGLAAMLLLGWMAFRRLVRSSPHLSTGLAAGFTVWALLFMFHASMRMAAVSFVFALGSAHLAAMPRLPVPGGAAHRRSHGRLSKNTRQQRLVTPAKSQTDEKA